MIQAADHAASSEEVRAALARALERAGHSADGSGAPLERFLSWLADALSFGADGRSSFLDWALLVLAALGTVFLAARSFDAFARPRDAARGSAGGPTSSRADAAELLDRARRAEEEGELLAALRLHFLALLAALGGRGLLAVRGSWTNRELLERGSPPAHLREPLEQLVAELDLRVFGGRDPAPGDVRRFAARCRALAEETS